MFLDVTNIYDEMQTLTEEIAPFLSEHNISSGIRFPDLVVCRFQSLDPLLERSLSYISTFYHLHLNL